MATYTATFYANTPKAVHAGVNRINIAYTSTASVSAGDIHFLAKLPNGARLVDFWEDHSTGAATCTLDLGLARGTESGGGASLSAYQSAGAQATKNRYAIRSLPPVVSTSDNDPLKYGDLVAKVAAIGTATSIIVMNLCVLYTVDDSLN